jgi:hypothetical protein
MLEVSTSPEAVDVEAVHRFLCEESHWAHGIPRATVERAMGQPSCQRQAPPA